MPRLVARRELSFDVSLLLALLRKRLAQFDSEGGETRLVLTRDEIVDLVRVFLPESSNEARARDRVETNVRRVVELGFLRPVPDTPTRTRCGASSRRSSTVSGSRTSTRASRSTRQSSRRATEGARARRRSTRGRAGCGGRGAGGVAGGVAGAVPTMRSAHAEHAVDVEIGSETDDNRMLGTGAPGHRGTGAPGRRGAGAPGRREHRRADRDQPDRRGGLMAEALFSAVELHDAAADLDQRSGYRLDRLEVLNWGRSTSTRGASSSKGATLS
ncbi:DUF4194 domain-containing protein [Oerskovia sp. M15]